MAQKNPLPEFDELDKEFSKNCKDLYDVMMTHFNKRIKLIETSRDILFDWLLETKRLKNSKTWDINKGANIDEVFPKKKGGQIRGFEMDSGSEDIGIFSSVILEDKTKQKSGWCIEVGFGLENVAWYIGQFHGFEKNKEYFDVNVYKHICNKAKTKLPKNVGCEINYSHPDMSGTQENDGEKWIEISIPCEYLSQKHVEQLHKIIKSNVLTLMLNKLKENSTSKGKAQ
jgi:hypothetical protein